MEYILKAFYLGAVFAAMITPIGVVIVMFAMIGSWLDDRKAKKTQTPN